MPADRGPLRGAGTGLSGGALPVADGIGISRQRMRRIRELDPANPIPPRPAG